MSDKEWCGHFSLDINGNCMRCAHEDRHRADMSRAWDEGERAGRGGAPGHGIVPNPYRKEEA